MLLAPQLAPHIWVLRTCCNSQPGFFTEVFSQILGSMLDWAKFAELPYNVQTVTAELGAIMEANRRLPCPPGFYLCCKPCGLRQADPFLHSAELLMCPELDLPCALWYLIFAVSQQLFVGGSGCVDWRVGLRHRTLCALCNGSQSHQGWERLMSKT